MQSECRADEKAGGADSNGENYNPFTEQRVRACVRAWVYNVRGMELHSLTVTNGRGSPALAVGRDRRARLPCARRKRFSNRSADLLGRN